MDRSRSRAAAAVRPKSDSLRYASSAPGAAAWGGLPERDRALLRWLLVGDVVTSELAAVLVYGSLRTARRRLARLVELGLLRGFWAANSQRPRGRYAYALVSSVRAALDRRGRAHQFPRRRDGPATTTIHQLATNDILAAFLRAARPSDDIGLVAWLPERAVASLFDGYVLPDALAVIGVGTTRICLFVERDLGTESARTVAAKVARYAAIFGSARVSPVNVGIVVESPRRAASVGRLLRSASPGDVSAWIGQAAELSANAYLAEWLGTDGLRLSTAELPGETASEPGVIGARCLLDADAADAFEPYAARAVPALRTFVREPESPA
jgi:hypothetical protein